MNSFSVNFREKFNENGLSEYEKYSESFQMLYNMLIETNAVMNLTALTDENDVIVRHFADCVSAASLLPRNAKIADIGCGGGFPTLPLAIVRDDIEITAVDSVAKKLSFVDSVSAALNLKVNTVSGRAEILSKKAEYREQFDVCISRAVARLTMLSELCIPLVKVGGTFISMKGSEGKAELSEAIEGIKILGADFEEEKKFILSDGSERYIFVFRKNRQTPDKYPRNFNKMKKEPVC